MDEIGLLSLAGKERLAIVAPDHTSIGGTLKGMEIVGGILCDILPRLVNYMVEPNSVIVSVKTTKAAEMRP